MRLKRVITDRRGVSSLFLTLYLAMLAILLILMLFFALNVTGSALTERLRIEQEKMQENIVLAGPEALKLTAGSEVHSIRINNTGSITVRIRALYIDHKLICDPSGFEGDAYIEPKESLWILLLYPNVNPPIVWNDTTMNADWTVTTERGTKASELGANLVWGDTETPYTPKKFYFGPLMIIFDMFHWRSGSGPWRSGWTIPKGTKDVTWRILVVNVDDRTIIVTETSCLTLISNDNSPKDPLPWYIDPTLSQTTFKPNIFNFVYYTWNKPFSQSGAQKQAVTGMTESTTCINFLTFYGSFLEANGTRTPFGQTIPFEAVLITTESMAASLDLTSNPENIRNDGVSVSSIRARVKDNNGNPVQNAWVDFYTTGGSLSATHSTTDSNGIATVTLTSSSSRITAYVTAVCQGVQGACKVAFTSASRIEVKAVPTVIPRNGGTSEITVRLKDTNNQNIAQSEITITVTISSWTGTQSKKPTLTYAEQSGYSVIATTDSKGQAIIILTAGGAAGKATITASASGLTSGNTEVTIDGS